MPLRAFRAPGRVNLIGEHTDYNDGFVMPAAIHFWTTVTVTPRSGREVILSSDSQAGTGSFSLDDTQARRSGQWTDYVQGVALLLEAKGYRLQGADLHVSSTVPVGSGLSSSAALEVSTGYALARTAGHDVPLLELARICQKAENGFVGMRCGIMDQFAATHGQAGHALLLDCRSLEYRPLPLPRGVRLVICNTMVKHELASSAYNQRRDECEQAARLLGVASLRDATPAMVLGSQLPMPVRMRAEHVTNEIVRTERAADALLRGHIALFGELMAESHCSLRDLYEVSCGELDLLVELANRQPGLLGARMTGAGFGGCTVNLVAADAVPAFVSSVREGYRQATGMEPEAYVCEAVGGVEEIAPA